MKKKLIAMILSTVLMGGAGTAVYNNVNKSTLDNSSSVIENNSQEISSSDNAAGKNNTLNAVSLVNDEFLSKDTDKTNSLINEQGENATADEASITNKSSAEGSEITTSCYKQNKAKSFMGNLFGYIGGNDKENNADNLISHNNIVPDNNNLGADKDSSADKNEIADTSLINNEVDSETAVVEETPAVPEIPAAPDEDPVFAEEPVVESTPSTDVTVSTSNDQFMAQVETLIYQKVNEERTAAGVQALSYNTVMEKYARIKSQDMGDNNYFNHNDLSGELITKKMQADGVTYNAWGENIAYISGTTDANALAQQFMTNWMNSQGHKENILSTNFTSIGVGVYKIGNTVYATQEFYR